MKKNFDFLVSGVVILLVIRVVSVVVFAPTDVNIGMVKRLVVVIIDLVIRTDFIAIAVATASKINCFLLMKIVLFLL